MDTMAPVTLKSKNASAFRRLESLWRDRATVSSRKLLGWPGGHGTFTVHWNPHFDMWAAFTSDYRENRYISFFGIGNPKTTRQLGITVEINIPKGRFDRRCAGVFLDDGRTHAYLAHTGKIGGGQRGVGKTSFLAAYPKAELITARWPDGMSTPVIGIGALHDARTLPALAEFVRRVKGFKKAHKKQPSPGHVRRALGFRKEFEGRKSYKIEGRVTSINFHGSVVNSLQELLREWGMTVGNDKRRDLVLAFANNKPRSLFEVKTALSSQNLYTGTGQLLLNSPSNPRGIRRILVLPGEPSAVITKRLKQLGIAVLVYARNGDRVEFPSEVLLRQVGSL